MTAAVHPISRATLMEAALHIRQQTYNFDAFVHEFLVEGSVHFNGLSHDRMHPDRPVTEQPRTSRTVHIVVQWRCFFKSTESTWLVKSCCNSALIPQVCADALFGNNNSTPRHTHTLSDGTAWVNKMTAALISLTISII